MQSRRLTALFVLVSATLIAVVMPRRATRAAGPWRCPLAVPGAIRPGDACASQGGSFGARRGDANAIHGALDLNSTEGMPVLAIFQGRVVVASGAWGRMGGTVMLDHGNNWYSVYGHLGSISVLSGSVVAVGDRLGTVGYTGNASCLRDRGLLPHLHLSMHRLASTGLGQGAFPLHQLRDEGHFLDIVSGQSGAHGVQDPARELAGLGCWN